MAYTEASPYATQLAPGLERRSCFQQGRRSHIAVCPLQLYNVGESKAMIVCCVRNICHEGMVMHTCIDGMVVHTCIDGIVAVTSITYQL